MALEDGLWQSWGQSDSCPSPIVDKAVPVPLSIAQGLTKIVFQSPPFGCPISLDVEQSQVAPNICSKREVMPPSSANSA